MIPLTAGFATTGQGAGPLVLTQRAGLFAKHGLDVQIRLMGSALGVVRGLLAGEIQFGNLAAPALLRSVLRDKTDLVFLTGGINQQFLMGRPEIRSRAELTGARIGFAGDGGINDVLVQFIVEELEKEGIRGLQLIRAAASGRGRIERLLEGETDAEVITPPESVTALRKGCKIVIDFAEYGLNFALGGIGARRSYVEAHEDIARKFVRAYVEGMHRYRTDRDFTVTVQAEYSGIEDRSIAEETYDTTQPGMPKAPYPVTRALGVALRVMSKALPEAADADPRNFVDDRFVRELEESGFIRALYGE
ncbi:MAG TPA: ABC transporter substrate-binding protein [Candidatus Acidoferrales bacterium]|nr:ABC transporter substrate-binding protein [Candidatus Acidoferrales bacterium]